jgi:ABC-type transport system involved in multi-copper enzyme maturation permease subunit
MNSFWRIFSLESVALVRSKTLPLMMAAATVWMFAMPYIIRSDGTAEGARELYIHYSLGGVLLMLVVSLVASATGSLARERAEKRLQLTLVRPVSAFTVAAGKICALTAAGALTAALAVAVLGFKTGFSGRCFHVLSPVMAASVESEAAEEYGKFMADPETPDILRKADKKAVLKILEQRALDRYEVLPTNSVSSWSFPHAAGAGGGAVVRMRFSSAYDSRQDVFGVFASGDCRVAVSNITKSVLTVPLGDGNVSGRLEFFNLGGKPLMVRPRQDVELLLPADAALWNMLRAWIVMTATLALVISVGLVLGAALGRPVALFTAVVTLIVGEMSPGVVKRYPDPLGAPGFDRIGLAVAEAVTDNLRPVSSMLPLEELSRGECVEWSEVARQSAVSLFMLPALAALLAAFVMSRKPAD